MNKTDICKVRNDFDIKGRVIAIIGATGILGTRYVKYLSGLGAKIVIGDTDLQRCESLAQRVEENGGTCCPIEVDNYNEESIKLFFKQVIDKYNQMDVLINNAQVKPKGFYAPFEQYTKETLTQVIDGNLIGVTLACREACKLYSQQEKGVIINIASVYGITAADQRLYEGVENIYYPDKKFSSPVSYAISKAGIVQLTKYLASYYRETGIRVNCLTPGGVYDDHDVRFSQQYSYRTTVGRMADKDEYNGAILFLCSDASSYMHGANLIVDGGWTSI